MLTGIAEGPEAIRAILGFARTLYDYQEFNFVGPCGELGFVEDYVHSYPVCWRCKTELLVHGWDLSRATGLPFPVPDDLAEGELAFSRPMLERVPAGRRSFAPAQPVGEDAPAIDRLVALLGRSPAPTSDA